MSQPSTPLSHAAADLFLPSMDQEQQLSQADFNELFGSGGSGQLIFSSNNRDIVDELNFTYGDASFAPVHSSNTSTISTPDFSSYDFGENVPAYPTNSPHPYPLDLQRAYSATTEEPVFKSRTRPVRAQTNDVHLYSAQPLQDYGRRRSLSTGDTDRIASANSVTNPTFVRLQAPRATTPEGRRSHGTYMQHGRCSSQSPAPRGRPLNPTSTPYYVYNNTPGGDMLLTPIGTLLNEMMEVQGLKQGVGHNNVGTAGLTIRSDDPVIRHMTRPEELTRSRQIIEIGALAVSNSSKLDPRLESHNLTTCRAQILRRLADIEEHLENKKGYEALSMCKTIRDTLSKEIENAAVDVSDEVVEDGLEAPSKVLAGAQYNGYDDRDDNDFMAMLMRENGIDGQEAG
jgi:hypothetical protein